MGQPRPGSGPVFLERLSCEGNESSILACQKLVYNVQYTYLESCVCIVSAVADLGKNSLSKN